MRRMWLLCGIPGSGKSTWIRNHRNFFAEDSAVVSRDQIRFSIVSEDEAYFSKEKEVWDEFISQIQASLDKNTDTIVDATHLNEASRGKVLRAVDLKDTEVNAIVINTSLDTAIAQNELREGREYVPLSAIRRMNSSLTIPTLEEGFSHIYIYTNENGKVKYQIVEKEDE